MPDYPIKFKPILKEKIWGGRKLRNLLGKVTENEMIGESWEISGVNESVSVVDNGPLKGTSLQSLLETFGETLVGRSVFARFGNEFPLLVKFIDAREILSVQVHPDDKMARELHDSMGKTEMWYVIQADKEAVINVGFQKDVQKRDYLQALEKGNIKDLLNFEKVHRGDCFFIQPGTIHAIGAGVLLAEIQQSSDITYRVFDWNRKDAEGKSRELHTDQALNAIDFKSRDDFRLDYKKTENNSSNIATCPFFTTNYLPVKGSITKNYFNLDSFVILMCVGGSADVSTEEGSESIKKGETIFIPAQVNEVTISGNNCELLEIYIK